MSQGVVLVVEDNDLERHTLMTLLRVNGYEVLGADDGQEALQYASQHVDVVLSDLRMNGFDGVELLRRWKASRPATPFIFVSGVVDIAQVIEAVKLGAEDYIVKPFRNQELLNRVADCVEAAREDSEFREGLADASQLEGLDEYYPEIPANATLEEIERIVIETSLRRHHGNRTHTAESLGISVRTLQRKLKAWAVTSS
jgi:DNA-binding NtrC family response regulator